MLRRLGVARVPAIAAVSLACGLFVTAWGCASTPRPNPDPTATQTAVPATGRTAAPTTARTAAPAAASTPTPTFTTRTLIAALKAYEARVGFAPTGNFATTTNEPFPGRCYYTGKLELPDSYQGLRVVGAANGRCAIDESQYDVFAYALETAATGSSAVTPALEGATLERLLMLVPHEDFHNQPEAQRAPPPLAEAAATLAGFVAAAGFAREQFGPDTPTYRHLAAEAELFARKARVVNEHHRQVADLYAAHRAGRVPLDQALELKGRLFQALAQACLAVSPAPVSFNRCPPVLNNAGLAFDRTYTRDYQVLFDRTRQLDVTGTVRALRETLGRGDAGASPASGSSP